MMHDRSEKRKWRILYTLFGMAYGVYLLGSLPQCSPSCTRAGDQPAAGYLGDEACQSCHAKAYADWRNSHHDLAMQEVSDVAVLGDFNDVSFESKGVRYRFFKKNDKFFVHTEGPEGDYEDFEIAYTFGVEPLQQYLVRFPKGRFQCLQVAWDTEQNRWFNLQAGQRFSPDDWMHWTKGSMTWNTMCADCHSTHLEKNYDEASDSYNTTWEVIDVSCEACHGPGQQHVSFVQSAGYRQGERVPGTYMHQTADLTNRQQVDQCARCHAFRAQQSEVYDPGDPLMDHYVPEILRPNIYHLDGQIKEEVYVYGSFLQSKMYHNNVKCTDCHHPHSLELKAVGNALCGQCHVPATYDTPDHHFHPVDAPGSQCVDCHMPGKYYMVNDFRRDHSFRVPRPDLSVRYGTPNACTQCHSDKRDSWAAEAVVKWYGPERQAHFSEALAAAQSGDHAAYPQLMEMMGDTSQPEIVRATALWLLSSFPGPESQQAITRALSDTVDLIRYQAVSATEGFPAEEKLRFLGPALSDSIHSIRAMAAYTIADVPERLIPDRLSPAWDQAHKNFNEVLKAQADFSGGQLLRGQYYHKQGQLHKAEAAYRKALEIDNRLPQPYIYLANIYYQQNEMEKARSAFMNAIEVDSANVDALYSLGLLLAELQDLEGAERYLHRAAQITGNPRHYYNWGLTLQHLNRPEEAENAYLQGLMVHPESQSNLYALAVLYIQQNEPEKARPVVEKLQRLYPQNPRFQELSRAIQ